MGSFLIQFQKLIIWFYQFLLITVVVMKYFFMFREMQSYNYLCTQRGQRLFEVLSDK